MLKRTFAAGAVLALASGALIGTASAQAAPMAAATACPHSGGDSLHFTGKTYQRTTTNGPLTIHLEDGYNPADGKQYVWTFVQGASKNDVAWVDYTAGSGYIKCGAVVLSSPSGSFYTTSFLTSSSSSVHMKACAEDYSTKKSVCTSAW